MSLSDELTCLYPEDAARALLGRVLVRKIEDKRLKGRIVETEVYHQSDPASHTYNGQTARNAVMFGPAGRAYVYFTYGMHHCFNVTAGTEGEGAAVLIRALEPLENTYIMQQNRHLRSKNTSNLPLKDRHIRDLCNGPAKLCQAMAIDKSLNGHDLSRPPLWIENQVVVAPENIITTTRVGITKSTDALLRFYIRYNPFISKR